MLRISDVIQVLEELTKIEQETAVGDAAVTSQLEAA
jgi:hypothetical protein